MTTISQLLIKECLRRNQENQKKIIACLSLLSIEDIWYRPNPQSNSMGNIILHLCGNIRQYILSTLGGQPDLRTRTKEFEEQGPLPKHQLIERLQAVLQEADGCIQALVDTDLEKEYPVQCYIESGVGILVHVTEHLSYHTGQLVYFTKSIQGKDLMFYNNQALEITSSYQT
jgi:uncharacterized damage-inducible protein DinB